MMCQTLSVVILKSVTQLLTYTTAPVPDGPVFQQVDDHIHIGFVERGVVEPTEMVQGLA